MDNKVNDINFIRERITNIRMSRGYSEREMSGLLDQSPGYINNIVNNGALPSMEALLKICELCGITTAEFFDKDIGNPVITAKLAKRFSKLAAGNEGEWLKIIDKLEPKHLTALLEIIKAVGN